MFAGVFIAIGRFIAAIPWQVWIIAGLLGAGVWYGSARYDAGVMDDRARSDRVLAEYVAEIEAARKQAAQDKLDHEARERAAYDEVSTRLEKEKADDRKKSDALIADLRAGNVRLQRRFACPAAAAVGVPGTAVGASERDGSGVAYISVADQEFLVRIGDEADGVVRQLTACQDLIRAR